MKLKKFLQSRFHVMKFVSVALVASRHLFCDDGFEFFFWGGGDGRYYCLRECLYSSVTVAALLLLRDGTYYHNGNYFLFTTLYHVIALGGTCSATVSGSRL